MRAGSGTGDTRSFGKTTLRVNNACNVTVTRQLATQNILGSLISTGTCKLRVFVKPRHFIQPAFRSVNGSLRFVAYLRLSLSAVQICGASWHRREDDREESDDLWIPPIGLLARAPKEPKREIPKIRLDSARFRIEDGSPDDETREAISPEDLMLALHLGHGVLLRRGLARTGDLLGQLEYLVVHLPLGDGGLFATTKVSRMDGRDVDDHANHTERCLVVH